MCVCVCVYVCVCTLYAEILMFLSLLPQCYNVEYIRWIVAKSIIQRRVLDTVGHVIRIECGAVRES